MRRNVPWESNALCHSSSPDLFFPPFEFEPSKLRRKRESKAKTICDACPVMQECLDYAMKNDWLEGVWGSTNLKERKQRKVLREIAQSNR